MVICGLNWDDHSVQNANEWIENDNDNAMPVCRL